MPHWSLMALLQPYLQWAQLPGYIAGIFVIASFTTKKMIPLRALSIASNVFSIAYGYFAADYPALLLQLILLPINVVRLRQMMKLVQRVRAAAHGDREMTWLKPYMHRRACHAEEVLFRKGDAADAMFYIVAGKFRLVETGTALTAGKFVGEIGFLEPAHRRTLGLICLADGEVLEISYEEVRELFFQNPDFGFYFMQLATGRLFDDLRRLEQALAGNEPGGRGSFSPAAADRPSTPGVSGGDGAGAGGLRDGG